MSSKIDPFHTPRPCPHCGQFMSKELLDFKRKLKGERVMESIRQRKAAGVQIGRPRTRPDAEIKSLHNAGLTGTQIAKKLGIGSWTVYRSLNAKDA